MLSGRENALWEYGLGETATVKSPKHSKTTEMPL